VMVSRRDEKFCLVRRGCTGCEQIQKENRGNRPSMFLVVVQMAGSIRTKLAHGFILTQGLF